MYTDRELAEVREDYTATFLVQRAVLLKNRPSKAGGGRDDNWQPVGDPVPARLGTPRVIAQEGVAAGQTKSTQRMFIEVPVETVVDGTFRITLEGATYEVVDTDAGRGEAHRQTVQVVKVK